VTDLSFVLKLHPCLCLVLLLVAAVVTEASVQLPLLAVSLPFQYPFFEP